jgi:hypothetical protein
MRYLTPDQKAHIQPMDDGEFEAHHNAWDQVYGLINHLQDGHGFAGGPTDPEGLRALHRQDHDIKITRCDWGGPEIGRCVKPMGHDLPHQPEGTTNAPTYPWVPRRTVEEQEAIATEEGLRTLAMGVKHFTSLGPDVDLDVMDTERIAALRDYVREHWGATTLLGSFGLSALSGLQPGHFIHALSTEEHDDDYPQVHCGFDVVALGDDGNTTSWREAVTCPECIEVLRKDDNEPFVRAGSGWFPDFLAALDEAQRSTIRRLDPGEPPAHASRLLNGHAPGFVSVEPPYVPRVGERVLVEVGLAPGTSEHVEPFEATVVGFGDDLRTVMLDHWPDIIKTHRGEFHVSRMTPVERSDDPLLRLLVEDKLDTVDPRVLAGESIVAEGDFELSQYEEPRTYPLVVVEPDGSIHHPLMSYVLVDPDERSLKLHVLLQAMLDRKDVTVPTAFDGRVRGSVTTIASSGTVTVRKGNTGAVLYEPGDVEVVDE